MGPPQWLTTTVTIGIIVGGGIWCAAADGALRCPPGEPQDPAPRPPTMPSEGSLRTAGLTPEDIADGWLSLFDGETLFGWRAESDANWRVESGAIVADEGSVGLLRTTTQFDDYILRFEYRAAAQTNSGVFLHTSPRPTAPDVDCYEWNIAPQDNPFPTGSLVARVRPLSDPELENESAWRSVELRVEGAQIDGVLDEVAVTHYRDDFPLGRGFIGLQFNSGPIAFRHLRLKPLGTQELFAGQALEGWDVSQILDARWEWTAAGALRLTGGRGQIESERQFGDFILSLAARTETPGTNSGVFFRCIPGELMNGYECQIHHGLTDGDPTRPSDGGTGALFRRQDARRVVSRDGEWFTLTIHACGPHVATWVNGYQVVDWTDTRSPDPNPRRGRRLDPGTIILQAHDPEADISFRDLRAKEIAPRTRR